MRKDTDMHLLKSALTAVAAMMLLPSPTGAETRLERNAT